MEIKIFVVSFIIASLFFLGTVCYIFRKKKFRDCWLAIILSVAFSSTMVFGGYQMLQDLWTLSH